MIIVSHNIDEVTDPHTAATNLKRATIDRQPEVYCLQECRGARPALIDVFGGDYRVLMSGAHGASLITMVHRDLTILHEKYLHMTKTWVGPHLGLVQPPRIHNVTDLVGGWRIVNLHRVYCPHEGDRGPNGPAFLEEDTRFRKLGAKPGSQKRTVVFLGDQNTNVHDTRPGSPQNLAAHLGARIITTGAGVDWGFVMNGNGHGTHGARLGSDHPFVTLTVTKK